MASLLGANDPFHDMTAWDDDTARQWVDLLDQRADAPDQARLRGELLRMAGVRPGDTALDAGCGTGALLVDLARAVGESGRVVGIDPQPRLVEAGRERVREVGVEHRVALREGRIEALDLADSSIDVCLAQTVLIHLPPETLRAGLAEISRVLVNGGRFASADQDGDTWTIDHPDRETTRRVVQFNSDQRYADGWTGRRLQRLFHDAGFVGIEIVSAIHIDTAPGSYLHGMAVRNAHAAAEAGAIRRDEAETWVRELDMVARTGSFCSSINYYICSGIASQETS